MHKNAVVAAALTGLTIKATRDKKSRDASASALLENAESPKEAVLLDDGTFEWNGRMCTGTSFHRAVLRNDLEAVEKLLAQDGAEELVQTRFSYETVFKGKKQEGSGQAIHLCASRGFVEMVQLLLDKKASTEDYVTRDSKMHYDVLHAAVFAEGKKASMKVIHLLFERRADAQSKNADGKTVLHFAYQKGSRELIEITQRAVEAQEERLRPKGRRLSRDEELQTGGMCKSLGIMDNRGKVPLEVGFEFGNLTYQQLADLAPLTTQCMDIFLRNDPRCIPRFVKRAVAALERDPEMLVSKYKVTHTFIADLLRVSPPSATELLECVTGFPHCQNPGWHPIPTRVGLPAYMRGAPGGLVRKKLNPPPDLFSFFEDENEWACNPASFSKPAWHSRLRPTSFLDVDIDVVVCYTPGLMSAEVFSALVTSETDVYGHILIKALVQQAWWAGAWRYDWLQVGMNVLALTFLTVDIWIGVHKEVDTGVLGRTSGAIFVASKCVVDVIFEFLEFRGYYSIGRWTEYFKQENFTFLLETLPLIGILFYGQRILHAFAVTVMWTKILGIFRCAENVAVVLVPIMRSAYSITPAVMVTMIFFLALTQAVYTLVGGELFDVVWLMVGVIVAGEWPEDSPKDLSTSIVYLFGLMIFSIFLLNIFISIISEAYLHEKDKVHLTLAHDRASGILTFLLRARVLPATTLRRRVLTPFMTIAVVVLVAFQVAHTALWKTQRDFRYTWMPINLVVTILSILFLNISVFLLPGRCWDARTPVKPHFLWLALPKDPDQELEESFETSKHDIVEKSMDTKFAHEFEADRILVRSNTTTLNGSQDMRFKAAKSIQSVIAHASESTHHSSATKSTTPTRGSMKKRSMKRSFSAGSAVASASIGKE
eukprot:TRINITY_DN11429_c0_g2_i1.p1 TRINITY_DN11429_c0_g2~~TRINITY_DN11429_c0_g2_i1.p1  ORF type:complete len:883 (-),score=162.93 TRINITY_DN11429_c0_g2_i1:67-2715(-)